MTTTIDYTQYTVGQLYEINQALEAHLDVTMMLNPRYTPMTMRSIRLTLITVTNK